MKLRDFIETVYHAELNHIYIQDDEHLDTVGTRINKQLLSFVNIAIQHIYSEFAIIREVFIIETDGTKFYTLPSDLDKILYIKDQNDREIEINNEDSFYGTGSIRQTAYNIIEVPKEHDSKRLYVYYSKQPEFITNDNIDTITYTVPTQLIEVLSAYIGLRAAIAFNPGKDQFNYSGTMRLRYEKAKASISSSGIFGNRIGESSILYKHGFS